MDEKPVVWSLGPTGRGYLYVGDVLIGPVEEGRLTARPADPHPSDEPGFVELSVSLHQRQVDRLSDLDSSISEPTQWRFKLAGAAPWSFPEYVIEQGSGTLTADDVLVIRSEWDGVEEGERPWFIRPSSAPPDVSLLRSREARQQSPAPPRR